MQRPVNFYRILDIENQQLEMNDTPRRRAIEDNRGEIPITISRAINARRAVANWFMKPEVLIHLIPVLIFVCFFILWWFSVPVTEAMKNDQMMQETHLMKRPHYLSTTRISLAIFATAAPPKATFEEISTLINSTNAHPVSGITE